MKRLTILALSVAMLVSCTAELQFGNVRLDFAVSDNSITKVTTSEVQSAVEASIYNLPVKISYGEVGKLRSKCDAGDVVTLPVGDVSIGLEYYGEWQDAGDVYFGREPYIYADTTITYHSYYDELVVRAHFKCAMVVVDACEVEDVTFGGQSVTMADYDTFKAFYVFSDVTGATTDVKVFAKAQTDFTDRTITINPATLEWGKWYMLSPTGITSGNAELGYDIDGFAEGGRL